MFACCTSAIGPRCGHVRVPPVDQELFNRTAPRWNCVDYADGMHYLDGDKCLWCGKTREQIARDFEAAGDAVCAQLTREENRQEVTTNGIPAHEG